MLKRIAILGPESTGKSYLSRALAAHYNGHFVKEYAREYIDRLGRPYQEDDILKIAQGQVAREDEQVSLAKNWIFCDSDLTVIDIWSQVKFGRTHPWIIAEMQKRVYDLYLLCDIDLKWEYDHQRENPNDREGLLNLYQESLEERKIEYYLISGDGETRVQNAIDVINKILNKI